MCTGMHQYCINRTNKQKTLTFSHGRAGAVPENYFYCLKVNLNHPQNQDVVSLLCRTNQSLPGDPKPSNPPLLMLMYECFLLLTGIVHISMVNCAFAVKFHIYVPCYSPVPAPDNMQSG